MGCAVACVGSRCDLTYQQALGLFADPHHAWTRGFYCREIVLAFSHAYLRYAYASYEAHKHWELLGRPGTIVFLPRSERYPSGHFFLRIKKGWMNPWSNFPKIDRPGGIRSKVQAKLPDVPEYVIYELD